MQTPRTDRPTIDERGGVAKLLVMLLVLVIAAGGAAYWFLIREDTKAKPKITQTKVVAGGTVDGTWTLTANDADGSYAQYRIGEQFAGGVVHSEATGHTNDVKGTMTLSGTTVSDINITTNLAEIGRAHV